MIAIKPASGIAGNSDAAKEEESKAPSTRTLRGLDCFNFFLAYVQTGVGPLLAIYLAAYGWNEPRVGLCLPSAGSPIPAICAISLGQFKEFSCHEH